MLWCRSDTYTVAHHVRELLRSLPPDAARAAQLVGDALNRAESILHAATLPKTPTDSGSSSSSSSSSSGASSSLAELKEPSPHSAQAADAAPVLPFSAIARHSENNLQKLLESKLDGFAAAVAASLQSLAEEQKEVAASTHALQCLAASYGLSMLDDSVVLRNGHCLPETIRWLLRDAKRSDVPSDAASFRAAVGKELLGAHKSHWHSYDSDNVTGIQFAADVNEWVSSGSWKRAVLPTALAAIPDTFGLMIVMLRTCKHHPLMVFAPAFGGVRDVVVVGHEVSSRSHFRPLVQSKESKLLSFDINEFILRSVHMAPQDSKVP